jgi:hypothetical protein
MAPVRQRRRRRRSSYDPLAALPPDILNRLLSQTVNASILPGRQEIRRARVESERQAAEDQQRSQQAAEGVAQLLARIAPQVQGDYQAAMGAQGAFARGLGNSQNEMQAHDAGAAAALLQRVAGAPAAQIANVRGVGAGVGDTSYALGGKIPGDLLNTIGLSATTTARELPAWALGRGQTEQATLRRKQSDTEKELDQRLADLMEKVPGLRLDAYKQLLGLELQKEAARTQRDYLGIAGNRQSLNERLGVGQLLGVDPVTGQPTAESQKDKPKAKAKAREQRLQALDTSRADAIDYVDVLAKGTPEEIGGIKTGKVNRVTYEQAYAKVWARYGQPILRYAPAGQRAWWKRQVVTALDAIVRSAGFKPTPKAKKRRKFAPPPMSG